MCRWSESNGGYLLWYTNGYVITSPYDVNTEGNLVYYGDKAEYATLEYADLLAGNQHKITGRCWGNLVQMYIDGQLVASHDISAFPMERDRNKNGVLVGLMFSTLDPNGASIWIDNLTFSSVDAMQSTGNPTP
jgi:hypothetical protein